MNSESLYFVEQTDFVVRFARCDPRDRPVRINRLEEAPANNPALLAETARKIFPLTNSPLICALRPRGMRLGAIAPGDAVAGRVTTADAFIRAAANGHAAPDWIAAADAGNGDPVKSTRWIVGGASTAAFEAARQGVSGFDCKPARFTSGTLAAAGALSGNVAEPTLLLEIGEVQSWALLIDPSGVLGVVPVSINRDRIGEAVQAELGQKNREAAALLFFGREHDFSDSGEKIARRLAELLKPDLIKLVGRRPQPVALHCPTLPIAQQWLVTRLAEALGLAVYAPNFTTWAGKAGVAFGSAIAEANLSPVWLGAVHAIGAQALATSGAPAWLPDWRPIEPEAGSAARPSAAPATKPATAAAAAPAKKAETARPTPVQPAREPIPEAAPKAKRPMGALIGGAVAVVAIGVGIFLWQGNQAEQVVVESKKVAERLKVEQANAREAEEQAKAEALAQKKAAADLAQRLSLAEEARVKAEKDAREQAAARLANARGNLVVATEPAGAQVTVGNLPPRPSPATFNDIKTGKYTVRIALAHYDDATVEVEVKENATTTAPKVALQRVGGTVKIASTPAGLAYELLPANTLMPDASARHAGQTPATVDDLLPGDYVVTFSRDGWAPHKETVSVGRNATAQVAWTVPTGHLKVVSEPSGATVKRKGVTLGVTPLTLRDQPPGPVEFELTNDEFDRPVTAIAQVEGGKTVDVVARFSSEDRVYRANEVDTKPESVGEKPPKIPYYLLVEKSRIEFECIVGRDGRARDFKVVRTTSKDLERYCVAAIKTWTFRPAQVRGRAVTARTTLVITKFTGAD